MCDSLKLFFTIYEYMTTNTHPQQPDSGENTKPSSPKEDLEALANEALEQVAHLL